MKRILHVVGGMSQGGTENFIMNIYRKIDKSKIQFDFLINREGCFDEEIKSLGGKIYFIPALQKIGYFNYIKKLDAFLVEHYGEYRIIHSHINKVSGLILERAKKNDIPIRIAHSHGSSLASNIIVRIYKEFLGSKINKNVTHRFACSIAAARFLYGNDSNLAFIIKNGIDTKKFGFSNNKREKIRKQYNITDKDILIGNIARFNIQKNHTFLLDIFNEYHRKHKNSYLMLVGAGELEQNIKNKIKKLNLENNVIFAGITNDTTQFYSAFDFFLFPSLSEGLGIVLIEAQVSGLNCLGSMEGIPKEAIISKNLELLSLKESAYNWSKNIKVNKNRCNVKMIDNYDINLVVDKISQFYLTEDSNYLLK
jgi:glycosyltransferase involved in cell wall biosynthesis